MKTEKQLYQWDVGQKLIECAGLYVDFPIGEDIYRVETADGTCIIPDELLQKSSVHKIYECMADNTLREFVFNVKSRPKPPDYVYTPTEKLTFDGLVKRVDDAVAEMIRRADSGEFDGYTPVKGTDYFTTAEIQQIQNEVSSGAIGDFKQTVDSETASFNTNAQEKLEAYNQNHTAKVAEYNQNAETKTAEFDANAAALQTEVDRLRGECDNLAAENRKQENRISALMKLNKGQTYDILPEEGETASRTAPSGAKYVSVDKVGGKSIVWNQLANVLPNETRNGLAYSTDNGKISITGTVQGAPTYGQFDITRTLDFKRDGRKYLILLSQTLDVGVSGYGHASRNAFFFSSTTGTDWRGFIFMYVEEGETVSVSNLSLNIFDLTQMFGSTIADYIYSIEQATAGAGVEWFKKLFPDDYYPYSEPTIISSQTDRVDVARADSSITQQITTGFPVLNSAGSVYDYIDIDNGKLHRRVGVVDLGTLPWSYNSTYEYFRCEFNGALYPSNNSIIANIICNKYVASASDSVPSLSSGHIGLNASGILWVKDLDYTDATAFKAAMSGVMLYYELAEEIITDIEIPTELTDWLTVEAGGSVTFHNADEGKRLLVPNKLSFVRKLDEVSV